MYVHFFKRVIDFVVALCALPFFCIIYINKKDKFKFYSKQDKNFIKYIMFSLHVHFKVEEISLYMFVK